MAKIYPKINIGIKSQLFLSFLATTLIIGISAIFIGNRLISSNLVRMQRSKLEDEAKRLDKTLKKKQDEIMIKAKTLSQDSELINLVEKIKITPLSHKLELLRAALELDILEVVDVKNNLIYATKDKKPPKDLPYDIIFRMGFLDKITSEIIPRENFYEIRAATPLKKGNKIVGVILLGYRLGEEWVKELKYFSGYDVILVNEGKILYSTLNNTEKYFPSDVIFKIKERRILESQLFEVVLKNQKYYAVIKPLYFEKDGTHSGFLCAAISSKPIQDAISRQRNIMTLITICGIIIAIILSTIISSNLSSPLITLTKVAKDIAEGDIHKKIDTIRQDEIGVLQTAFNKMTENLTNIIDYQREQIEKLLKVVKIASSGDLSVSINIESDDDFGKLSQGLNQMIKNLRKLVEEINITSLKVAKASSDISKIAQEQEIALGEQILQTTEIAQAMQELTQTAKQIALSSSEVKDEAEKSSNAAKDGGNAVENSIKVMQKIQEIVSKTSSEIHSLNEYSKKIIKATDVIQHIADKINLLALNAGIEAARAGDAGRGFAVIADEIRKLAEQSSSFAEEINTLIYSISEAISSVAKMTDYELQSTQEGTKSMELSGKALQEIIILIEKTSRLAKDISSKTEEQTKGSIHVSASLSNLSQVVKWAEKTAKKTSQSAKLLQDLADELKHAVEKIRL